jgi:hypothetical protein
VFRKLTEQKIPRLKDKNKKKECYYGEKKRHTVKIQYMINKKRNILYKSSTRKKGTHNGLYILQK